MALMKPSPLIQSITGSIGNTTFQGSTVGTSVRNKSTPRKTSSQAQSAHKKLVARIAAGWASLSLAEQAAWSDYAAIERLIHAGTAKAAASGYTEYFKRASIAFPCSVTVPPPPVAAIDPRLTTSRLNLLIYNQDWDWASPPVPPFDTMNVWWPNDWGAFTDAPIALILWSTPPVPITRTTKRATYVQRLTYANDGAGIDSQNAAIILPSKDFVPGTRFAIKWSLLTRYGNIYTGFKHNILTDPLISQP